MKKETSEYIVRDFSAVDRQVEEMANREKALTWRLKIENVKRLGIPLILLSCALSILLLAFGAFIWLVQQERIVEIEKIVEVTREVPIISERIKVVEVPIYIETPRIKNVVADNSTQEELPDIVFQKNTTAKLGNLSLAKIERMIGSTECVNSSSYQNKCVDTWEYPNGAIYDGFWYKGQAHGTGSITYKDGGSISGTWENGELKKIKAETKSILTPLKSVTYFSTVSGNTINKKFFNVNVGHEFGSGTDTQWLSAYCYVDVKTNSDNRLQVSLSRFSSYQSKVIKNIYKYSADYSKKDFSDAQNKCPYSWTGFN